MKGFAMTKGKNIYFLESNKQNKCKSVIDAFINKLADVRGLDEQTRQICLEDESTRNYIYDLIGKYTYEFRTTDNGTQYHHLESKNCIMNFPVDDCDELIFI